MLVVRHSQIDGGRAQRRAEGRGQRQLRLSAVITDSVAHLPWTTESHPLPDSAAPRQHLNISLGTFYIIYMYELVFIT